MDPFGRFHRGPGDEKIPRRIGRQSEFMIAKIRENQREGGAFLAVLELKNARPGEKNSGDDVVDGGVGGEGCDLIVERDEKSFSKQFLTSHRE